MTNEMNTKADPTQRTMRPQELHREQQGLPNDNSDVMMQQQTLQAKSKTCPFCGAENDAEYMFCSQCGQPIGKAACPHCGADMDPDADFCEICHHYIKKDVCSYCGAALTGNEAYCPECGSPRGGLVCPTCHTLNDFAFCKKCGTALTEEAKALVKELQLNPDYQELVDTVQEYSKLENALPYNSERDIIREQKNNKLRERILTLLAQDEGIEKPVISAPEQKRMTKDEGRENKGTVGHTGQVGRAAVSITRQGPQLCHGQQARGCTPGVGLQLQARAAQQSLRLRQASDGRQMGDTR